MAKYNYDMTLDPRRASILVVDDEVANLKLVEKILHSQGYDNVVCTLDPTQVIELYKLYDSDLILLDLDMPLVDGYAVMQQLNTLTEDMLPPVLVLTAQHQQDYRQRALDNGARDYVTKPFNINELLSRVHNLLEVHIAHKWMRDQNELLEQKVRERTQAIHDTRLQVVRHLGRAAEYRDNETGLHIIRMSNIAALLGKAYGMSDYESDLLLNAAPMHDIGKIGIPDHILLKPGKLEPDEWEIMKTHAQVGANILSGDDSDLMLMAYDIAISHHEKWNGTGYPIGLKGEEIPLVGRVTALADVYDALMSERPYKKAWTLEHTVEYIKQQSGEHFDPNLVEIFLSIIHQVADISKQYSEPERRLQ